MLPAKIRLCPALVEPDTHARIRDFPSCGRDVIGDLPWSSIATSVQSMRIALFGPPGAGKGTQAAFIEHRFGFRSISTGALIRTAIADGTPIGEEARCYVEDGRLVPDDLVRRLAESAVEECDFDGFILDGYPRTLEQARALDTFLERHGAPLDALISLHVPDEDLVERLSARRLHPKTGASYHLVHNPPPSGLDASRLVQRADDRPEAVRRRLKEYHAVTEPVMRYYDEHYRLVRVNGSGRVADVARRLTLVLDRLAEPV